MDKPVKGTHMGIRRVDRFIQGFFMSSDRGILCRRREAFAGEKCGAADGRAEPARALMRVAPPGLHGRAA